MGAHKLRILNQTRNNLNELKLPTMPIIERTPKIKIKISVAHPDPTADARHIPPNQQNATRAFHQQMLSETYHNIFCLRFF